MEILSYVLVGLTLTSAIVAAQIRDLTRAIIAFTTMSILVAVIFFVLGATYVALFQLLVYAGAVTALFLVALHTLGRGKP